MGGGILMWNTPDVEDQHWNGEELLQICRVKQNHDRLAPVFPLECKLRFFSRMQVGIFSRMQVGIFSRMQVGFF